MNRIESIILRALLFDEGYARKVLPFFDEKYFGERTERTIFTKIQEFSEKYSNVPTKEAIVINLDNAPGISQDEVDTAVTYLNELEASKDERPPERWLIEETEAWCQERAIHNAVLEVINILDDKGAKKPKGVIPKLLQDALAVSFDPHVGHDYLEDADSRYDFYQRVESRLPFHLRWFNKVTKNGIPNKTLNVILAGTGVGKSLFMCDLASHYLSIGKNVLYITLEMAEERIAERIDANLMDVPLDDLREMPKPLYAGRIDSIKKKTQGRLIIKEYPTAQAHSGHFRGLINELALKKNFKPDVIFIDYLNICASSRVRNGQGGTYELIKSIAEELRGLGVEFEVPIWTATQTNRSGYNNNDPDLTNTSESFGLPATADFMFALIADEELVRLNQILVKILKNRYSDVSQNRKFLIGVDRSKMKLFDLADSEQEGLSDSNHTPKEEVKQFRTPLLGNDDPPFDVEDAPRPSKRPPDTDAASYAPHRSVFKSASDRPRKQLNV